MREMSFPWALAGYCACLLLSWCSRATVLTSPLLDDLVGEFFAELYWVLVYK